MNPHLPSSIHGRRKAAFTLIELLVVIVVMIILIGIMMPAIKSLTRNNNQKQAVNLLTSLIANARSLAISSRVPAAVIVYEDTSFKGQSSAQLVIARAGTLTDFVKAPRTGPQTLPQGIRIGVLEDGSSSTFVEFKTQEYSTTDGGRIILFDSNGQLVLRNELVATTDPVSAKMWFGTSLTGVSRPGFVIYNMNDLKGAQDKKVVKDNDSLGTWLKQNADVLIINAYTGSVIR